MTQHSTYNIADQSGTSFRADLNTYLKAVLSNSAGSVEPPNPLVGQFWYDTINHQVKIRNSTNTDWTALMSSVTGEVNSVAGASDTVKVEGYPSSVNKDANTLILRDGTGKAVVDVIGDSPSGDAVTLGGYTNAQLKAGGTVTGREHISVTAGDNFICGGGWYLGRDPIQYYKVPFPGTYRIFIWTRTTLGSSSVKVTAATYVQNANYVLRAKCKATTAIDPVGQAALATGTGYRCWSLDVTMLAGETFSAEFIQSFSPGACAWALGTDEYGWKFIPESGSNIGDLATMFGTAGQWLQADLY